MARIRKYIDIDVVTAATQRVAHCFDVFDSIAVMFSGGKDSLVTLELCRREAEKRGKLPLNVVFRDVILSPYPRSAVGLKVHQGKGSTHGYHRDTNPISALLYLITDNTGGATRLHPLDHPARALRVVPQCGRMLLMRGREIRHCGESLTDAQVKIVAPLNYYTADDQWRPEGIDTLVYGG